MTLMPTPTSWSVYLLQCRDGSYYCGISNDVQARFQAHVQGRGARYTRAHPPVRILGSRPYPDRASAARAEWQVKQLPRDRKLAWLLGEDRGGRIDLIHAPLITPYVPTLA